MKLASIGLQVHNTDADAIELVEMPHISTNEMLNKPMCAFWTSTFTGRHGRIVHSAWNDWAYHNGLLKRKSFLLVPKSDVHVLEIDSYEDYADAKKLRDANDGSIDFGWYAEQGFDGIHVTERAISECRVLPFGEASMNLRLSLWDVESTCWFHLRWIDVVLY